MTMEIRRKRRTKERVWKLTPKSHHLKETTETVKHHPTDSGKEEGQVAYCFQRVGFPRYKGNMWIVFGDMATAPEILDLDETGKSKQLPLLEELNSYFKIYEPEFPQAERPLCLCLSNISRNFFPEKRRGRGVFQVIL